jgi:hypothetical protein
MLWLDVLLMFFVFVLSPLTYLTDRCTGAAGMLADYWLNLYGIGVGPLWVVEALLLQ